MTETVQPETYRGKYQVNVKRIDFGTHVLSIGIIGTVPKPVVRKEYLENSLLNIYDRRKGNPVIEELMDKVILKRSIPLDDGIETLKSIKEKTPYLADYVDGCVKVLNGYKGMV